VDGVGGTRHRLTACRVRVMEPLDSPPVRSDLVGGSVVPFLSMYQVPPAIAKRLVDVICAFLRPTLVDRQTLRARDHLPETLLAFSPYYLCVFADHNSTIRQVILPVGTLLSH